MRYCPNCESKGVIQECHPASVVNYLTNIHDNDLKIEYDIIDTDYSYDKESFVCAECNYNFRASCIEELYFEMREGKENV
jgi:hypothetical protein